MEIEFHHVLLVFEVGALFGFLVGQVCHYYEQKHEGEYNDTS